MEACQSKVNVTAYPGAAAGTAAGIAGINEGTIRHCIQTGDIQGPGAAGGIAGNNKGVIEHCYSTGVLLGKNTGAGGIAVENSGTIRSCAAMEESITALDPGMIGGIALSNTGTLENNYIWSEMKLEGTLVPSQGSGAAEDASLYGKESAITLITQNKNLFPEDMWVCSSGFYPMLAGQTDMNYILPHQINNGREVISAIRFSIPAPVVNQTPVTALAGDGWTAAVAWSPALEGTFDYSTAYTAAITVTLDSGYMLDDAAEFFVNGDIAAYEGSGPYLITVAFPETEEAPEQPEEETEQPETPSGEEEETEQPDTPADGGDSDEQPGGASGGSGGDAGAAAPETTAAESQASSEQAAATADGADTGDTAPIMLLTLTLLAAGTIALAIIHKKQDRA